MTRSTPACAGPTSVGWLQGMQATIHPRVRGAYLTILDDQAEVFDPPPRARGLPFLTCVVGGSWAGFCMVSTARRCRWVDFDQQ